MTIDAQDAKKRVVDLFRYIKELKLRVDKPILHESEYDWLLTLSQLPNHPCIQILPSDDEIFRIRRPEEVPCPNPPKELIAWLKPSWTKIKNDIEVLDSINIKDPELKSKTLFFKDLPNLMSQLEKWKLLRDEWKKAELPSEQIRETFSRLHEVKAKIDKESERIQLYLTEGVLVTKFQNLDIKHPLVFKEVGLAFESNKKEPEFVVTRTDVSSFLNLGLLRFVSVDGSLIANRKKEFEELNLDPDEESRLTDFLRGLAHYFWQDGKFSEQPIEPIASPTIYRDLKIVLAKRQDNFIEQIENYIKTIQGLSELPVAFENIVGRFTTFDPPPLPTDGQSSSFNGFDKKKNQYFLTKEYNIEQKRIIDLLDTKGCVSVQGPPGTGKSHTIANLIGHLLAKGNNVLISSYSTKALNVIREKVSTELQPLCVSVLDQDIESKKQLQISVNFIDEMLSKDSNTLASKIESLTLKRDTLDDEISKLEQKYLSTIINEYKPIGYQGEAILPKDSAIYIAEHSSEPTIEGPFETDICPLSNNDWVEVKNGLLGISPADQLIISKGLPEITNLITPENLEFVIAQQSQLKVKEGFSNNSIVKTINHLDNEELLPILTELKFIKIQLTEKEDWLKSITDSCLKGDEFKEIITNKTTEISGLLNSIKTYSVLDFKYRPSIEGSYEIDSLISVATKFANQTSQKIEFTLFERMFSKEVKILNEQVKAGGKSPSTPEEFLSVVHHLKLLQTRKLICEKWDFFVQGNGDTRVSSTFTNSPEIEINHHLEQVMSCLTSIDEWKLVVKKLQKINIQWPTPTFSKAKLNLKENTKELHALLYDLETAIIPSLEYCIDRNRVSILSKEVESSKAYLQKYIAQIPLSRNLLKSLEELNSNQYSSQIIQLLDLSEKSNTLKSLIEKLVRLKQANKAFYEVLIKRTNDTFISSITNFEISWKSSFLDWVLTERNSISPVEIQHQISERKRILKEVNAELIKNLVWSNQIKRTQPEQRQALRGWVQSQNKITKAGKGVLDQLRKRESKTLLRKCKSAVPVWIMPLARVLDNFNLGEDQFDVLIIDEASQADLTNIPVFSLAKKVIVVGDDKQVSPPMAGKELQGLEGLMNEFLGDVPNKQNYDYKYSLYDIACASFGDTVRLNEHFRCVPEIIQFCNDLSYNGSIKALRESLSNPHPPALIPYFLEGVCEDNINKAEANFIVAKIKELILKPEHKDTNFGVISLKGPLQHAYIDEQLRNALTPKQYEHHRILCGKAPQFQGDERDIIFLSMVDSPESEGPLTLISPTDDRKKEYNVAVSRARNQLWVVHSMNAETQLKAEDIRLRLLKHAKDPRSLVEKYSEVLKKAESPFERSVHEDLIREGIEFKPQYEVGAYRIDIVIRTPQGMRIALECDGEKFHSTEEQIKQDLERQSVLERLGFRFVRIRGSDYYRNKTKTMERVFKKLEELGLKEQLAHQINEEIALPPDEQLPPQVPQFDTSLILELNTHMGSTNLEENVPEVFRDNDEQSAIIVSSKIEIAKNHLLSENVDFIDKTLNGGCLWVIDTPKSKKVIREISKKLSIHFTFTPNGSKATKDRAAWYLKDE